MALIVLLAPEIRAGELPSFVVIYVDNFGNGDLQCFNPDTLHRTPNVDRLAAEGTRFTSFYVASGVCTPSRAALMTGCYPRRVNMHVSEKNTAVLQPVARKGLHPDEDTIADDVHEDVEVSAQHSSVVTRLTVLADSIRKEIGDMDQPGVGQRPAGWIDEPQPLKP